MTVAKKKPKMRRTQISLTAEQFEAAKRIAEKREVSVAQVLREGLDCVIQRSEEEDHGYFDVMWSIVGICEGTPDGSVKHDEVLYGRREEHFSE
ncbi:MAG: hypothetical protein M1133_01900 [Armatimonadetes bacterium]|nr:hypothetical protein [Armatimonadota bacterium]